jgi:deoxycytidine triphosphate deaminase
MDLSRDAQYPAEDYFEPLISKDGGVNIQENEHYLLSTEEILVIPDDLNVELMMHSNVGVRGELHFAGFVDNGFRGDLVLEVRSSERSNAGLRDGMPISKLEVFRTEKPDKLYGKEIGSHYFGQIGPKPPKYCRPFDYAYAARNYAKLNRDVLCQDRKLLMAFRKSGEGFESGGDLENLLRCVSQGFFHSRYDCDPATDSGGDELAPQIIPYVLIFGPNETVFRYVRAKDIKDYGEHTLFGKHSIGIGGHINRGDAPSYVPSSLRREVDEEVSFLGEHSEPRFVGTLVSSRKPVDRVHFGLVYTVYTNRNVTQKESSITSGKLFSIDDLVKDPLAEEKFETWSHLLLPDLRTIYNANLDLIPR